MFYHLSASVGSGKTKAVFDYFHDHLNVGYLFVCPTNELCEEAYRRLLQTLVDRPAYSSGNNLRLINGDNVDGLVFPTALEACRQYDPSTPPILIITRPTLLFLCETLSDHEKVNFEVFIDEGMTPIEQIQFAPSDKQPFLERFLIGKRGLTTAASGQREILEIVARDPRGMNARGLGELAVPEFREICRWVVSENYDAFVFEGGREIEAIGVLAPRKLQRFRNVTMIVAAFDLTLLPRLWESLYGVRFEAWPHAKGLFDTHTEKGPYITLHYLLHPDDLPSKQNLHRNAETGEPDERDPRLRVVYALAKQVNAMFPDGSFCWAANNPFMNEDEVLEGRRMPTMSAGLDEFRRFDNVVSLVAINPKPWVQRAIKEVFALEGDEVFELWRFGPTYQTIGRCSLRDRCSLAPVRGTTPRLVCRGADSGSVHKHDKAVTWKCGGAASIGSRRNALYQCGQHRLLQVPRAFSQERCRGANERTLV